MFRLDSFRFLFAIVCWVGSWASPLDAQEWAERMFNKLDHDFGTVARGADTVYRFEVTNLYKQTMHITGVRSSCGCTSPSIEHAEFKTHEKAYIVAKFNTRTFTGRHGATLTVSFGAPFPAEVQVRVHGNIRGDVVFEPGAVQFGNVDEGQSSERQVTVNFAGNQNWRIVDVTNDNDHFEVELQENFRSGRKVSYGLLVRLRGNVPPGYIKDQLTIVTNDPRRETQRIPLFVEGRIIPEISVTPASLTLGDIDASQPLSRKVVVRGKKPFKITGFQCSDDRLAFSTDDNARPLHLVEVQYRAGTATGPIQVPVQIMTDRGENRGVVLNISANPKAPAGHTELRADGASQSNSTSSEERVAGAAVQ